MPFVRCAIKPRKARKFAMKRKNDRQLELLLEQPEDQRCLLKDALRHAERIASKRPLLGRQWWAWANRQIAALPRREQTALRCALTFRHANSGH